MLTDMTEATLVRLQRDWRSVKVLVIAKIIFVSATSLNTISQRLGRVLPSESHLPFGGLHVLMCGDPFQLSPVGARPLWPQKRCRNRLVHEQRGTDLYMECDAYFELTKGQRNHGPFYDALSAVRVGKPTARDIRYLNSRHDRTLKSDAGGRWTDSTVIVGTNKEVDAYNGAALLRDYSELNDKGQILVKRTSRSWTHVTLGKESDGGRERTQLEKEAMVRGCLSRRRSLGGKDQFVPNAMNLYVGQRVMLTYNMCVELGLFNGGTGTVYRILGGQTCDPHESKEEGSKRMAAAIDENAPPHDMPIVLVQMDSSCYRGPSLSSVTPGVVAISAVRKRIKLPAAAVVYQLPLVQANAFTVHKTQALTMNRFIIDASKFFAPASWYVALSRVRSIEDVSLVHPISSGEFTSRSQVESISDISDHLAAFRIRFIGSFRPDEVNTEDRAILLDPYN